MKKGALMVMVQYSNGTDTFMENTDITGGTLETLKYKVQQRINALNANEVLVIPIGAFDPTPAAPAPTPQADVDYANFSRWLEITTAINAAKSLGWITGAEQMVIDAKNKVLALAGVNLPRMFT
jgi:hypothetical protein